MIEINELLQKINKADYERLDKVIISVSDLLLLRRTIIDSNNKVDGLECKLEKCKINLNNLVSKHLKTYKDIGEL